MSDPIHVHPPVAMHILIAGGGLGGLALAQGLIKDGHTVEVYERDQGIGRQQGYYLTINGDGGESLHRVLPEDLYELYLETSRQPYPTQGSIVRTPKLDLLGTQPSLGRRNVGPRRHTGVDRNTLRRILGTRIGESIRWGVKAESYEENGDGVTLRLGDGSTARGDILVIANGIHSTLRDQRLPGTRVISTAIRGIDLYARATYTPALLAQIPEELHDSVTMVIDGNGNRCLLGSFRPRRPIREAAVDVDGAHLDPIGGYMMVSCSVPLGTPIPPLADWTEHTGCDIKAAMQVTVAEWHPGIRAILEAVEPNSVFPISFSYLEPQQRWDPSRVTVLGDAAHGMLPTKGMGANATFHDAAFLCDRLADAAAGRKDVFEAVGEYEAAMRSFAYPVIAMAADHDNQFGGGAISRAEAISPR
jgi:2-polyprenyl-6-methoxyphenol hydroxylase-like FAD-dependent oxidoreductase